MHILHSDIVFWTDSTEHCSAESRKPMQMKLEPAHLSTELIYSRDMFQKYIQSKFQHHQLHTYVISNKILFSIFSIRGRLGSAHRIMSRRPRIASSAISEMNRTEVVCIPPNATPHKNSANRM